MGTSNRTTEKLKQIRESISTSISVSERIRILEETWEWQRIHRENVFKNEAEFLKFNHFRWAFYLWAPIPAACTLLERVGNFDDGGKFQCNLYAIEKPCIIYSFGIYSIGEEDFDVEIAKKLGCQVFGFDPTISSEVIENYGKLIPGGKAFPWALGPVSKLYGGYSWKFSNYTVKSLIDITRELKHSKVDILKIDIEKSEHAVLPFTLSDPNFQKLGVTQIAIELHFVNIFDMKEIFEALERAGYYPVMNEKNYRCDICVEYLFVHKSHLAKPYL